MSAVYGRPVSENLALNSGVVVNKAEALPGPSHSFKTFDPIALVKNEKKCSEIKDEPSTSEEKHDDSKLAEDKWSKIEADTERSRYAKVEQSSSKLSLTEENLERRLNIEEEVTFVCGTFI